MLVNRDPPQNSITAEIHSEEIPEIPYELPARHRIPHTLSLLEESRYKVPIVASLQQWRTFGPMLSEYRR